MKRIRCPKCDEAIIFDEKLYAPGRVLVFECPACSKQFRIRIPAAVAANEEQLGTKIAGRLIVVENAFHFKQEIPLYEGENVVGRFVKGTSANAAFKTVDPSVDTSHCIITVRPLSEGSYQFVLRDAGSNTGTFYEDEILGPKSTINIEEGAVITLGATTIIFRTSVEE